MNDNRVDDIVEEPLPNRLRPKTASPVDVPKTAIAKELIRVIRARGLTQTEAGYIIRDQPSQISLIANGHLDGFSVDRLARYLAAMGRDVELRIATAKGKTGRVRVITR